MLDNKRNTHAYKDTDPCYYRKDKPGLSRHEFKIKGNKTGNGDKNGDQKKKETNSYPFWMDSSPEGLDEADYTRYADQAIYPVHPIGKGYGQPIKLTPK